MTDGSGADWAAEARAELAEGMAHDKCHACGCMHDGLARLERVLDETGTDRGLLTDVREWRDQLEAVEVDCRGCPHCYPAEATNIALDAVDDAGTLRTGTHPSPAAVDSREVAAGGAFDPDGWPPIPGEYHAMCTGSECPVAVSTLGDGRLADDLATDAPEELCIVGETRTENTGIEKLLKNVITNPTLQVLVLAGPDPDGHRSGETLKALLDSGVSEGMEITDAPGRRPVLANTTTEEVRAFRDQITVVDRIGCSDPATILETVAEAAETACTCGECLPDATAITDTPPIEADPTDPVEMDPAGYFVVIPRPEEGTIVCEHYDYRHTQQHVVEGASAEDIYRELIERDLVSRLDHAAYLGAELAKAELAVSAGYDYEQGGCPE